MKLMIIGMLHNEKANLFHPITFRKAPHSADGKEYARYKSGGHHTEGFNSREEAVTHITDSLGPRIKEHYGEWSPCLERDFPWDGEGVPAMVLFFSEPDASGNVQPLG